MKIGVSLPVRELADDLGAIKAFAQLAEELGLAHLRIPEQVLRPGNGHLHEPMMLLSWVAAVTTRIELVPSVIILPSRQTVLFAKQAATLDRLSGGRLRIGIGVGGSAEEYQYLGADFHTRGRRCDEQIQLLHQLWTQPEVDHTGHFDQVSGAGLNPLPIQRPIPLWVGARPQPAQSVIRRIGRQCDGWFVLCDPDQFPQLRDAIAAETTAAGRDPAAIGMEAGVAVVGPREAEWQSRVANWRAVGLTHLCLRTLGGDLDAEGHLRKLREIVPQIPQNSDDISLEVRRLKLFGDSRTNTGLRARRAVSWIGQAERYKDDDDARFIFLWLAFDAAYGEQDEAAYSEQNEAAYGEQDKVESKGKSEHEAVKTFLKKLVECDEGGRISDALRNFLAEPLERFMKNEFVFRQFWKYYEGRTEKDNWEDNLFSSWDRFQKNLLSGWGVLGPLQTIFERLYVLRNQMLHGAATWHGSINRPQVQDGTTILAVLMPIFVDLMMEHRHLNWGKPRFPLIEEDADELRHQPK